MSLKKVIHSILKKLQATRCWCYLQWWIHRSVVRQIMCSRESIVLSFCRSSLRAQHGSGVLPVWCLTDLCQGKRLIIRDVWYLLSLLHRPVARPWVKNKRNKWIIRQKNANKKQWHWVIRGSNRSLSQTGRALDVDAWQHHLVIVSLKRKWRREVFGTFIVRDFKRR